jgi:hypothetical protein
MSRMIIVFLGLLASCAVLTSCGRSERHPPPGAIRMEMPKGTPHRPQGMEALTVKPGPEPFSRDDVTQFVRTHRLARSVGDLSQLNVEGLEFITAGAAAARLQGASTGLPDDQRVAFAIIRGPLYFTAPLAKKPIAFDSAYALFDAKTGNLLMSGTLDVAKQPSGEGQKPGEPSR